MYPIRAISQKEFPSRLLEIPDAPQKLFVRGALPPEDFKWLCVVGARRYTSYGKEICERLIGGLSGFPVTIVSGLALGIDGIAHKAALGAGLSTVAVPGSGLSEQVLYPRNHVGLSLEILKKGGALISEFEPNFEPAPWSFPQRNRIMAGLSDAVLVIEAELKSGTLITSRLATDYDRDVFAVPGSVFSSTSEGPHMLIRLGAVAVTSLDDLKLALGFEAEKDSSQAKAKMHKDCSSEELSVIKILKSPRNRDELIAETGLPISKANILLTSMELKGLIKEVMGEIRLV